MATTHALLGVAVAALSYPLVGEHVGAPLVLAAAFCGGLAPDIDVFGHHRKTMHFPVGYTGLAAAATAGVALAPSTTTVLVAAGLGTAALHALSDVFGGSPEPEPWNPTVERAVFNHLLGRWHRPRRYVRYSGAPEDFLLGLGAGLVAIAAPATPGAVASVLWGVLAFSAVYTLSRKRLGELSRLLAAIAPGRLSLPSIRVVEHEDGGTTVAVRFQE
ncbi:metal-dependent hydrolase [Haloarcula halophila]|uniref:metal-dependent hydrolase n=1 Tax=Haloarcula TaxID=2237 RepID=UPI0023E40B51|nr:metal-dependent hydrolase [Halomicroarcula sp. DFY41]